MNNKIIFISGVLDHINLPLCDELYAIYGDNFCFISTVDVPISRLEMGYKKISRAYEIHFEKSNSNELKELIYDAKVVLYATVSDRKIIRKRLRSDKITIKISERFYKTKMNFLNFIKRTIGVIVHYYFFNKKNKYILCQGGYVTKDLDIYGLYKNKRYKWGYFTENTTASFDQLMKEKEQNKIPYIFWIGRLIDVKQPFSVIKLASYLQDRKLSAKIRMAGYGPLYDELENKIKLMGLNNISLIGSLKYIEKEKEMNSANIFIFTSNEGEGWGAVLNEAMGSGCLCIASKEAGATPFLIENEKNGFVYSYKNQDELNHLVEIAIQNKDKFEFIQKNAYFSINKKWNVKVAAKRLSEFIDSLITKNGIPYYEDGPLSKA